MRAAVTGAAALVVLLTIGSAMGAGARTTKDGGTFLVAEPATYIDSIDPTLGSVAGDVPLYSTTCSSLMRLPDKPLPAGFRSEPELAAGFPKVSHGGKTYVFTIRKGLRFSTGAPVRAADVRYTINRILDPVLKSPSSGPFEPIVGARDVLDGKATTASGVVAKGYTLTIRLTHPVGDFIAGAATALCVLPATSLPIDPEGVQPPVPTAAPYYISQYVPSQRIVLERNRFYRGSRPQHVDSFVFDLTPDDNAALDADREGKADYAWVGFNHLAQRAPEFARLFGVNKRRFFVKPGTFLHMFVLNTPGPLFRHNVQLRQAINYAIDRPALIRQLGSSYFGRPTDQFLVPLIPGFTNARIYPLDKPDLARARALATGHRRSGKLVLYVSTREGVAEQAQIVKQDLKKIGLDVAIKAFPSALLFQKLGTRGEPFDMGWIGFQTSEPDPVFLSLLFDGSTIGTPANSNWSYFDSPKYNRLLHQASRRTGEARYRSYGKLDVELARDAAPGVAYSADNALALVSARTGCVVVNPYLDLGAVCLK
jgi:ABC-type transport system substrate-binding protein